jgi:hypothetical protein
MLIEPERRTAEQLCMANTYCLYLEIATHIWLLTRPL